MYISVEEAEQFFRRALALIEAQQTVAEQGPVADAIVGLLEAIFLKCDMPETRKAAESYLPRLLAMGDTPQLAFALYFLGSALQISYQFKAALVRSKEALEVAERTGNIRAVAYARMLFFSCSTVLGRFPLEVSVPIGARVLKESQQASDNYVLNWAYFCIAWDYGVRGLMNEAQAWALKLIEAGQQRGDRRALGFAHWTLAWLAIVDARYNDALKSAEACLEVAVTPFDRVYGAAAKATASMFTGHTDDGLRQLLEVRRLATENGPLYGASGMHGPAGVGFVITGRIAEGIHLIDRAIEDADAAEDFGVRFWNRIVLAEIYLELLTSRQLPPLGTVLKNLGTIIGAKLFGKARAQALLEQASRFEQLHERGVFRARINMDLGLLYKIKGQPALARQFLEKARGPAEQQGATVIVNKIDSALAELH